MPQLRVYRLKDGFASAPGDLDTFVDLEGKSVETFGPVDDTDFRAKLYRIANPARIPRWAPFLVEGFNDSDPWRADGSTSALLVLAVPDLGVTKHFAIPFGQGGRFLLKSNSYVATFGLKAALNIIHPSESSDDEAGRLRSVDARRHGPTTVRSRLQATSDIEIEEFDFDQLRDVVNAATGRPHDGNSWGARVSGGDALTVNIELPFDELGALCLRIDAAAEKDDYRARYPWLDYIQPVADEGTRAELEAKVVADIARGDESAFVMSPPEIVDWSMIDRFLFPAYARLKDPVLHQDLRVNDYIASLKSKKIDSTSLTADYLRSQQVKALDANGETVGAWRIWQCLAGSIEHDGVTYILEDGHFFSVSSDYLDQLNKDLDRLAPATALAFPQANSKMHEDAYAKKATTAFTNALLVDKKLIIAPGRGRVELCDILLMEKKMIHLKRHLSSKTLSHLFAQGGVAAELIQADVTFRKMAFERVKEVREGCGSALQFESLFPDAGVDPREFEIVFGVIADWGKRDLSEALPFFSKVNLRRVAADLRNRGYEVATARIQVK